MAYFDNAATTFPKPECVYKFMDQFYRNCGGSAGRGQYASAQSIGSLLFETRELIKELLHCPSKSVVFEPTDTIALNIIIQGVISSGAKNIYVTPFEHNAVTRTLYSYQKNDRVQVIELAVNNDLSYDLDKIRYQFEAVPPNFVIISHASNVMGLIAPAEEIFEMAKKHKAITLLDMAQTAGLVDCNVGLETIDFATFAGHKTMLGPTGIAGFVMKPNIELEPILFGGTGIESANQDMPEDLPARFEMGTMNTVGIAGLNAALKWIQATGMTSLFEEEQKRRSKLIDLLSEYDYIKIIGNNPTLRYVGIVSCLIDGISSDSAGELFNRLGVSVRTGLQCAPMAHKFMNTFPAGTVRFSVNSFTTDDDFMELQNALDYIEDNL
ncbi:MAG: aminotransferase class V-fold PLP-dependent enzyme [Bacillus sp. (in: firmicutes)]